MACNRNKLLSILQRHFSLWLLASLCMMIDTAPVLADRSVRCDGRIVSIGASQYEVLSVCGEPDHRAQWEVGHDSATSRIYDYERERYIAPELVIGPIQMERWTYDLGSNKFIRYLLFQKGKLIKISTGERGRN